MLDCEIPKIAMNFRTTQVWAHQHNLPWSNWKRSLGMKRRPTKMQRRFRSKWMVGRFSIQLIPVQCGVLFSTQSTTNLNVSWWGGQATGCLPNSPIDRWLSMWLQVFNSRPAWNHVSGAPGLGNMVHCEEMALGFRDARSAGGRWNGPQKDVYLGGSSYDMPTADWERCCWVARLNFVGEYTRWRMGEYGTELPSQHYQWRTSMESVAEIEFSSSPCFRDPDNSSFVASSAYFGHGTNWAGHNVRSGRDIQERHWQDDIWNSFQTGAIVASRKCKSHPWGSEHEYWWATKLMEYPQCFIWYLNILSATIKQWPTLTLFMEFWDFWWVSSVQYKKWCGLVKCDECENCIPTSCHCNARITFTLFLAVSDDTGVFRCTWRFRGWCCDRKAQHQGTVYCS